MRFRRWFWSDGPADRSKDNRLVSGSYRARPAAPDSAWKVSVDLACDVALENADDLARREPFGEAALEVVAGAGLGAEAGEHDPPQRMVRLAVPAPVEPMAGDLP